MRNRLSSALAALLMLSGLAVGAVSLTAPVVVGAEIGPAGFTQTTVSYSCRGAGFASYIGTLPAQPVTMTLIAPTAVTVGQPFELTADITPLALRDAGFPISAPGKIRISLTGATGNNGSSTISPNVVFNGATATVPQSKMSVSPTAAAGESVRMVAQSISILVGSTGFICEVLQGQTPAEISTQVLSTFATTTTSTSTTTTAPGQTTSTTLPGETTTTTATSTTTTAPVLPPTTLPPTTQPPAPTTTARPSTTPTTAAPQAPVAPTVSGSAATIITPSASATFTCNIYDERGNKFNQNALPASQMRVTLTIPDKVGVGGTVNGLVRMDPGPLNGPIKLRAGTVNYSMSLSINGGSPSTVRVTGGPNGSDIQPNASSASPNMAFSTTATAGAGGRVVIGVTQAEALATVPTSLTTRCNPTGSSMSSVGSVAVVAGQVQAPAGVLAASSSGGSGSSGSVSGSGTAGGATGTSGFASCSEAKAAGRGVIPKSDPAYKAALDADSDGLACEAGDPAVLGVSLARTGSSTPIPLGGLSVALMAAGLAVWGLGRRRS